MQPYLLSGTDLYYHIRISPRAKRGRIMVTRDKIEVILPKRTSLKVAHHWIQKKAAWVKLKWQQQQLSRPANNIYDDLFEKNSCQFQGNTEPFSIEEANVVLPELYYDPTKGFVVYVPKGFMARSEAKKQIILHWFNYQAQLLLQHTQKVIEKHGKVRGLVPEHVTIKQQKTLWGSCSTTGNISLNLALMGTPTFIQEYVIIHELCHLKHHNHSRAFWYAVAEIIPNYQLARRWLRDQHHLCHYFSEAVSIYHKQKIYQEELI